MRKISLRLFVVIAIEFFLGAGFALADSASDEVVIAANSNTATQFGASTGSFGCGGCFNPLDAFIPEGFVEFFQNYFIGFRPASLDPTTASESYSTAVVLTDGALINDIIQLSVVATFDASGKPLGQNWLLFFSSGDSLSLPPGISPMGSGSCPQDGTHPQSCLVFVPETNSLQDISADVLDSNGQPFTQGPLFTIGVQSSGTGGSPGGPGGGGGTGVPEPSSLLLLATGILGITTVLKQDSGRGCHFSSPASIR
jgi:hypothetical protein